MLSRFLEEQRRALPPIDETQLNQLLEFESWLGNEALPAGGLGPNEADRILHRHVLDALVFLVVAGDIASGMAVDVGSGVGLPGIPLAIALRGMDFVLLDRSGRRCHLIRRAVRVLGLDNVTVVQGSIEAQAGSYQLVTSRASLPPGSLLPHLHRIVADDGTAVVAGSATRPMSVPGYVTVEFRSEMLGIRRWMLMMRPS